jgi:hypothetical protein
VEKNSFLNYAAKNDNEITEFVRSLAKESARKSITNNEKRTKQTWEN